jgi:cytochrome c553
MNRYDLIGIAALVIVVVALPVYAVLEPSRMGQAQGDLREQFLSDGAAAYVENCALCHGPEGEGVGAMPALNNPALADADHDRLYDTIAHSPHGTVMSAWHIDEGGMLNDYQVEGLVTLIRYGGWRQVVDLATERRVAVPTPGSSELALATMDVGQEDPHECQACHEEPDVHADRFGLNCSRCHTLDAWKPALLLRHTFMLDHGGQGPVSCQTCHTYTYAEHTCYECHDHTPEDMKVRHQEEGIYEYQDCVTCHPTGQEGEAQRIMEVQAQQGPAERLIGSSHTD